MERLKEHIANKNYVAGLRQIDRLLAEGKIAKIYLAADADEAFKRKVFDNALRQDVQVAETGTRKEFAALCKIRVGCAAIGILASNDKLQIKN